MADRWEVFVTSDGVRGCTGSFRWLWRARLEAHSKRRYWPGPKQVEIMRTHDFHGQPVCPACGLSPHPSETGPGSPQWKAECEEFGCHDHGPEYGSDATGTTPQTPRR